MSKITRSYLGALVVKAATPLILAVVFAAVFSNAAFALADDSSDLTINVFIAQPLTVEISENDSEYLNSEKFGDTIVSTPYVHSPADPNKTHSQHSHSIHMTVGGQGAGHLTVSTDRDNSDLERVCQYAASFVPQGVDCADLTIAPTSPSPDLDPDSWGVQCQINNAIYAGFCSVGEPNAFSAVPPLGAGQTLATVAGGGEVEVKMHIGAKLTSLTVPGIYSGRIVYTVTAAI